VARNGQVAKKKRTMLKFNEGKVCEAIIRHLESRERGTRAELYSPEKENHSAPVELVWSIGSQLFALEHTGIEPFAGLMKMAAEEDRHFGPIKVALANVVPCSETWDLNVPAKALQGSKPGRPCKFNKRLSIGSSKQPRRCRKSLTAATKRASGKSSRLECHSRYPYLDSSLSPIANAS